MGKDGQLYTVLLNRDVSLSWHKIVSGWWRSQQQGCYCVCRGFESCGEDYVQVCICALEHTRCTRQNVFSEAPTARPTGFAVDHRMWGARTSEGTGGVPCSGRSLVKIKVC